MIAGPFIMAGQSTTVTEAANMSQSNILSVWRKQESSRQSGVLATIMTMLWLRRSTAFYKAEAIHRRGPRRSFEVVEFATLEWVDWFNHRRLLESIVKVPPSEAEQQYYNMLDDVPVAS